ncbi:MAG: hypothetical protein JRJ60_13525 [Deltaproteobacteria bacterium]|nr:hypothetical protein [Deltaproteobacteria bacterium]
MFNKLHGARKAVQESRVAVVNQLAVAADAMELGYDVENELQAILADLLEITTPNHYTGTHPPQRSYEQMVEGLELFAFAVESSRFKCRIYYKFALTKDVLWLVSLHASRLQKEGTS